MYVYSVMMRCALEITVYVYIDIHVAFRLHTKCI